MVQNYSKTQGNRYTSKMNRTAANLGVPNFDPSTYHFSLRSPVGNLCYGVKLLLGLVLEDTCNLLRTQPATG